jgi:hypothetical protein
MVKFMLALVMRLQVLTSKANSRERDCHYVVPVFDAHIGEIF